jgi:hypothetical protein
MTGPQTVLTVICAADSISDASTLIDDRNSWACVPSVIW